MPDPIKRATTVRQQIALLQRRGMEVDEPLAEQWLSNVHYYRLAGYAYPFRRVDDVSGAPTDDFQAGTSFSDVVQLYEFDRKLRTLVHDAVERIETGLRAKSCNHLAAIDPLAYLDKKNFRHTFDHGAWLRTARKRVKRAEPRSTFVQHNLRKYGNDLPIWALVEVLDFSDLSKLFSGMTMRYQFSIADSLGLKITLSDLSKNQRSKAKQRHPAAGWLEQITIVRNTAAHHGRLWNISFVPVSGAAMCTIPSLTSLPQQSEQMYGALSVMAQILNHVSPGTSWSSRVHDLIHGALTPISLRNESEMGFPTNWREQPLWTIAPRAFKGAQQ